MIGIGRRSGPLLVGLVTGGLVVGVMTLAAPPAARPADLIATPAAASTQATTSAQATPAPAAAPLTPSIAPAAAPAPTAGPGRTTARRATPGTTASRPTTTRPSPTTGRPAPAATPAAVGGSQTAQVVALTNVARARAGCAALRTDARLTAAAQAHSADMAANDYFAHDGLDGSSFAARIEAQGYPSPGGENIAQGQRDAQEVVTAWLNSPGHRANIDNCSFTTIGVGLAGGEDYWTQDFGR